MLPSSHPLERRSPRRRTHYHHTRPGPEAGASGAAAPGPRINGAPPGIYGVCSIASLTRYAYASSKEKISTEASPSIGAAGKEGATTGKKQAARKQERQPEVGFFLIFPKLY